MRIELSRGFHTLVDDDVDDNILKERWKYVNGYAYRDIRVGLRWKRLYLHREITGAPADKVVDHINGDRLDNRRENLRICTQKQNAVNRRKRSDVVGSIYKGVRLKRGNYEACIADVYLGTFYTEVDAAHAYNLAAIERYGEFACLNVLPEWFDVTATPKRTSYTSKYRGVMFHKRSKKWQACLNVNKKRHHLGYFELEVDAAKAYNEKASEMLGDAAKLNVLAPQINAKGAI